MGIDDRDYMRDRNRESSIETRRFQATDQLKKRQAENLKRRFANYSGSHGGRAEPKTRWKHIVLILLVTAIGTVMWMRAPDISSRFLSRQDDAPFPLTGAVRWFIPATANGADHVAPLSITGPTDIGRNVVVRLDTWDTHAPVAMIPIRSGEIATLQVPLGRYRITYSTNASWQGDFKLLGDVQEGIEPLEFYRAGNQVMGHRIDLNGRINGNLKTRRTGYF